MQLWQQEPKHVHNHAISLSFSNPFPLSLFLSCKSNVMVFHDSSVIIFIISLQFLFTFLSESIALSNIITWKISVIHTVCKNCRELVTSSVHSSNIYRVSNFWNYLKVTNVPCPTVRSRCLSITTTQYLRLVQLQTAEWSYRTFNRSCFNDNIYFW